MESLYIHLEEIEEGYKVYKVKEFERLDMMQGEGVTLKNGNDIDLNEVELIDELTTKEILESKAIKTLITDTSGNVIAKNYIK